MSDRLKFDVSEEFDSLFAENVNVHLEMLDNGRASLTLERDGKRGLLILETASNMLVAHAEEWELSDDPIPPA